jgi:hypothetical protein
VSLDELMKLGPVPQIELSDSDFLHEWRRHCAKERKDPREEAVRQHALGHPKALTLLDAERARMTKVFGPSVIGVCQWCRKTLGYLEAIPSMHGKESHGGCRECWDSLVGAEPHEDQIAMWAKLEASLKKLAASGQ